MVNRLFHLITFVATHHTALCSILRIGTVTEKLIGQSTREINVTCTLDDPLSRVKDIVVMEMVKHCNDSIAVLRKTELSEGDGMKANMQAKGFIGQHTNTSDSYLRLTISNPDMEDDGAYSCLVFYEDAWGKVKEERVSVNVTVDNDNERAVLISLINNVAELQAAVNRQGDMIDEQHNTIQMQEINIKDQEKLLKEQNLSINECKHKIDVHEKQLKDQKDQIAKRDARDSYVSAFSVGYDGRGSFGKGDTLVFRELIMQAGDDYNMSTGVFTASRHGLYVFHLGATSYFSRTVHIDLVVRGISVGTLYVNDKDYSDQSSVSTVVSLQAGDQIKPVLRYATGQNFVEVADHYSVLTGYLLKLL